VEGSGKLRVAPDGLFLVGDGEVVVGLLKQGAAPSEICQRVLRVESHGDAAVGDSAGEVANVGVGNGLVEVGRRVLWNKPNGLGVLLDRLIVLTCVVARIAELKDFLCAGVVSELGDVPQAAGRKVSDWLRGEQKGCGSFNRVCRS
jgi:hypothetical protein